MSRGRVGSPVGVASSAMIDGRSLSMSSEDLGQESTKPSKRRRIQHNQTPPLSPCPSHGYALHNFIGDNAGLGEVEECGYPLGIQPYCYGRRTSETQVQIPGPDQEVEDEVCFGMARIE